MKKNQNSIFFEPQTDETIIRDAFLRMISVMVRETVDHELTNRAISQESGEQTSIQLITRNDLVKRTGLSLPTIHRLMKEGVLPYSKIGRATRFREDVVKELINRGEIRKYKRYGK